MKDEKHIRDSTTNTIDGINDKLPVRLDPNTPTRRREHKEIRNDTFKDCHLGLTSNEDDVLNMMKTV